MHFEVARCSSNFSKLDAETTRKQTAKREVNQETTSVNRVKVRDECLVSLLLCYQRELQEATAICVKVEMQQQIRLH